MFVVVACVLLVISFLSLSSNLFIILKSFCSSFFTLLVEQNSFIISFVFSWCSNLTISLLILLFYEFEKIQLFTFSALFWAIQWAFTHRGFPHQYSSSCVILRFRCKVFGEKVHGLISSMPMLKVQNRPSVDKAPIFLQLYFIGDSNLTVPTWILKA